ncbi:MAG: glycosyltransferase [Bacteroidales bacterium]
MKDNILLISRPHFGTSIGPYKWTQYLRKKYNVTTITYNTETENPTKYNFDDVKHIYISKRGNKIVRALRFILYTIFYIAFFKGRVIVTFFPGCSIYKRILFRKPMILDIRTLGIFDSEDKNIKHDKSVAESTKLYDHTIFLSEGMRNKITDDTVNTSIVPLGADILDETDKLFDDSLRLLYIGRFYNRDIHKTIEGVHLFHTKYPEVKISYDIIGFAMYNEDEYLYELVNKYNLSEIINFRGAIHEESTKLKYIQNANIGVSFVPITPYYDFQPVTKSFEYILSGLFCIATDTYSNREIITSKNGILINDTPESFSDALEYFMTNKDSLNSTIIRDSLQEYNWESIVNDILIPRIENTDK